ncbi:hypothetical protein TNCT_496671 [Trichonephila clavata]|uniref:Uncharacterized protein n=1 Tax=Trichonephila clavata TaxID=2740835 RepID=A0A8X6G9E9_TRICU|nr:hypothetical protein TNCT_496671 [Trichonephila clavata]
MRLLQVLKNGGSKQTTFVISFTDDLLPRKPIDWMAFKNNLYPQTYWDLKWSMRPLTLAAFQNNGTKEQLQLTALKVGFYKTFLEISVDLEKV